jgi:hypothetical protein
MHVRKYRSDVPCDCAWHRKPLVLSERRNKRCPSFSSQADFSLQTCADEEDDEEDDDDDDDEEDGDEGGSDDEDDDEDDDGPPLKRQK